MNKIRYLLLALVATVFLSSCIPQKPDLVLVDAKMTTATNENFMPVHITSIFPKDTLKVSCWFQWKNAKINTPIIANWRYLTDDIDVINYPFNITRKDGSGSVSLVMPEGKALPSGQYQVTLRSEKRTLKSLEFTIQ